LNHVDVKLYPEGGDLIEELECGLYLEAFTKQGDPADLMGLVVDVDGKIISQLNTVVRNFTNLQFYQHEGRGKTTFTPKKGNKYFINVIKPTGIKEIPLPVAKQEGCSLMSTSDVYECDDALSFKFGATKSGKYLMTIYKKELQLTRVNVKVNEDNSTVPVVLTLPTDVNADGVLRVTVTDSTNKPVAERLIFRKQTNKVNVKVVTDYKSFTPGDKVKLRIQTTNDEGKASNSKFLLTFSVSSNVCVTVTDESVLESVEKRKHHPRIDTMVYLENEVDHLDDATIYLSEEPIASKATDLLLGTQGWRRFANVDVIKFIDEKGEKGEKIACVHRGNEKPNSLYENGMYNFQGISYNPKPPPPQQQGISLLDDYDFDIDLEEEKEDRELRVESIPEKSRNYSAPIVQSAPPPQPKSSSGIFGNLLSAFTPAPKVQVMEKSMDRKMEKEERRRESPKMKKKAPESKVFSAPKGARPPQQQSQPMPSSAPPPSILKSQSIPRSSEAVLKPIGLPTPIVKQESKQSENLISLDDYEDSFSFSSKSQSTLRPPTQNIIVREYAHKISKDRKAGSRVDFTETLFWNAVTQTDENGRAIFEFDLSDSITSFRAYVDAFTDSGVVGTGTKLLSSKEPFYMEPILPIEVSSGDLIQMPIALVNSSSNDLEVNVSHSIESKLVEPKKNKIFEGKKIEVESENKKRIVLELDIKEGFGRPSIVLSGDAGAFSDKVTRNFGVVPSGFPTKFSTGSLITSEDPLSLIIPIPEDIVPSSVTSKISFFSSPLSNIGSGLETLLKEPCGCFEQVSSTTYPTVMAHQYFTRNPETINPRMITKSEQLINRGYKKLIGYECKDGGFEWFGHGSGHEGLTFDFFF
jgi:alpha-2-macroglobulin-like protein